MNNGIPLSLLSKLAPLQGVLRSGHSPQELVSDWTAYAGVLNVASVTQCQVKKISVAIVCLFQ